MKLIIQIATLLGAIIGFITMLYDKNQSVAILQTPLTFLNIGLFSIILPPSFLFLFVMLAIKERKDKRICLTTAQSVCLGGFFLSCCYAFMTYNWLDIQETQQFDAIRNTIWKLLDTGLACFMFGVIISYCLNYLGYFPMIPIKPKRPVGGYARDLSSQYGIDPRVMDELIEEAYKKQQEDTQY